MENKNNNEWCKHFKNSFANCSLGDYTLNLGKFENGDQYRFEININLEGLYGHDDGWGEKKININGRGIHELSLIGEIFAEIAKRIEENTWKCINKS